VSMTVGLECGHWLQLRDREDTREENIPERGPWTFYPLDAEDTVGTGDLMTCLVCQTVQQVKSVTPELIPLSDLGRPIS
jgi:hypothetical protein